MSDQFKHLRKPPPKPEVKRKPKAIVLLSGGLDSAVLAGMFREQWSVLGLFVDYGQKAMKREARAARHVANFYAFPLKTMVIGGYPMGGGVVIPNRNMVLISMAVAYASYQGALCVGFAGHQGDHEVFPDCRQTFVTAMDTASKVALGEDHPAIIISAPFMEKTKADIMEMSKTYGAPVAATWSCYEDGPKPCGECLSCVERNKV